MKGRYCKLLLIVIFLSISLVYVATFTKGWVGLHGDSVAYLSVAENLREGKGLVLYRLFENSTHLSSFPFMYPLILSIGRTFIFPFLFLFNSFCLAITLFIFNEILNIVAPKITKLTRAILILSLLTTFPFLYVHVMALAEPLFITISLSILYLTLSRKFTLKRILLITLLSAALPLIRYAGVFIFPFVGLLLLIEQRDWIGRIKNILLYSFAAIPIAWWMLLLRAEGTASRRFVSLPISYGDIFASIKTVFLWFVPNNLYVVALAGILVSTLCIFTAINYYKNIKNNVREVSTLFWFGCSYYLFIITSYIFFDRAIASDFRRILVLLIPVLLLTYGYFLNYYPKRVNILMSILLGISIGIVHGNTLIKTMQTGADLSCYTWRSNSLLLYVSENRTKYNFISNAWEPMYVCAGVYVDRASVRGQEGREKEIEYFNTALSLGKPLAFAYSSKHNKLTYLTDPQSLSTLYDLEEIYKSNDGQVFIVHLKTNK